MSLAGLTNTDIDILTKLNSIDFGPIAFKLMNAEDGKGWNLPETTQAIEDYRRFLFLTYLYPDRAIVPTQTIDRVWHTHILDTIKYREDCQLVFGRFLDHWPYFGMLDEHDRQNLDAAFADTQDLWREHFPA
jgi:hypothetical protein